MRNLRVSGTPSVLCWYCSAAVAELAALPCSAPSGYLCSECGSETDCGEGIWRCISPERLDTYRRFIVEYELIRAAEGRGSLDPAYYLALPYEDLSGKMSNQWKVRACTFDYLKRKVLAPHAALRCSPLRILDLGAGNGWLSYRLARLGHLPVAVDLLTNSCDGLGAAASFAPHLPVMFPRVQAIVDQLPFASDLFDVAIFNASFHYSQNYARTLAETLRCLRPGGLVVIADTPWYARLESGLQMVEQKHARFHSLYGFTSSSIASQEFLTPDRLQCLALDLGIEWRTFSPFYGIGWSLRPLHAKIKGRRSPSQFRIYVAEVAA